MHHSFLSQYNLEYGKDTIEINVNIKNKRVLLVDDLLATGGTVNCVSNILKDNGKKITGLLTVVELIELEGRSKFDFPVESWLKC